MKSVKELDQKTEAFSLLFSEGPTPWSHHDYRTRPFSLHHTSHIAASISGDHLNVTKVPSQGHGASRLVSISLYLDAAYSITDTSHERAL